MATRKIKDAKDPMEVFEEEHYVENDIVSRCIKDSGIALSHNLNVLVGLYVEEV